MPAAARFAPAPDAGPAAGGARMGLAGALKARPPARKSSLSAVYAVPLHFALLLLVAAFLLGGNFAVDRDNFGPSSGEAANGSAVVEAGSAAAGAAAAPAPAAVDLPVCARADRRARTFLLLFMGHSGSTAIITALKQHSQVFIDGLEPVDHGALAANSTAALEFAERFFLEAERRNKTGGFKIRPRHLLRAPVGWAALMRRHGTRVVWNYRSNTVKASIGHYPIKFLGSRAAYEGVPVESRGPDGGGGGGNSTEAGEADDTHEAQVRRLHIADMQGLAQIIRDRTAGEMEVESALRTLGRAGRSAEECTLPLSYEALLEDERGAVRRVQQFLGVSMDELHLPLRRKATHDNLCELVENHREVCNAFFGCVELRWMLEDTANDCTCSRLVTGDSFNSRQYCSISTHAWQRAQYRVPRPSAASPGTVPPLTALQHAPPPGRSAGVTPTAAGGGPGAPGPRAPQGGGPGAREADAQVLRGGGPAAAVLATYPTGE